MTKKLKIFIISLSAILLGIITFIGVTQNWLNLKISTINQPMQTNAQGKNSNDVNLNYEVYEENKIKNEYNKTQYVEENSTNTADNIENFVSSKNENNEQNEENLTMTQEEFETTNILAMIYNDVAYELMTNGFTCIESVAYDSLKKEYFGITYTDYTTLYQDSYGLNHIDAGFVQIAPKGTPDIIEKYNPYFNITKYLEKYIDLSYLYKNNNIFSVAINALDTNIYECNNFVNDMKNNHFVYKNKYISYYWESTRNISYTIQDNIEANYDKNLGSLYSYDTEKYIYDTNFTYEVEEVTSLFDDINFDQIQETVNKLAEEQRKLGYAVSDVTITLISTELIEEYYEKGQPETFYGYDSETLKNIFGDKSNAISVEIKDGELTEPTDDVPGWIMNALRVIAGVIVVVSIISSFATCGLAATLIGLVKFAITTLIVDTLVTTAFVTALAMGQGASFKDAISFAWSQATDLQAIADGLLFGAALGGFGTIAKLWKFCFAEDTLVSTANGLVPIQNISKGDLVYSYDSITNTTALLPVNNVSVSSSISMYNFTFEDQTKVSSTFNHKWFVVGKGWLPAEYICENDKVLTLEGQTLSISEIENEILDKPIATYNLDVGNPDSENFHTFYVGESQILVHNSCANFKALRSKGVKNSYKQERLEFFKENPNTQNWQDFNEQGKNIINFVDKIKNPNIKIDDIFDNIFDSSNNIFKKLSSKDMADIKNYIKQARQTNKSEEWILDKVFNSKYVDPSDSDLAQLLVNKKVKGYDGAHIIDVKTCKEIFQAVGKNAGEKMRDLLEAIKSLVSDGRNVVFLKQTNRGATNAINGQHRLVHALGKGNNANVWKNSSNIELMEKFTHTTNSKLKQMLNDPIYKDLFQRYANHIF